MVSHPRPRSAPERDRTARSSNCPARHPAAGFGAASTSHTCGVPALQFLDRTEARTPPRTAHRCGGAPSRHRRRRGAASAHPRPCRTLLRPRSHPACHPVCHPLVGDRRPTRPHDLPRLPRQPAPLEASAPDPGAADAVAPRDTTDRPRSSPTGPGTCRTPTCRRRAEGPGHAERRRRAAAPPFWDLPGWTQSSSSASSMTIRRAGSRPWLWLVTPSCAATA